MPADFLIYTIILYVVLSLGTPLLLGLCLSLFFGRSRKPAPGWQKAVAQSLVALGLGIAYILGSNQILSYPASLILGALLYAPGLFMLGFQARLKASPQE
ncbi:hypothetical protein ACWA7J_09570 [Leptothrix sp. BB-4]